MKKFLVLLLALTLVATAAIGCSTQSNDPAEASDVEATEEAVEEATEEVASKEPVTFWMYEGVSVEGELIVDELMAEFTEKTGYEVNVVYTPKDDFKTKLASSIAIGEGPDVAYMDQPDLALYADDDLLLDLTDLIANDDEISPEDYHTGAFETNLVGDRIYGLPLSHTTVAIFYNKDLVQNVPSTWDEWIVESKRIFEESNGEIAAFENMWGGGGGAWLFPAFVHNAGGQMVNDDETACVFADQGGLEAVNLILDLYEYSPLEVRTASNAFLNGLAAFKMSGPWDIGAFDDAGMNYGVMLMPTKEGDVHYSNIGGDNMVVFKDSANNAGGFELVKFLTNAENNGEFVKVGGNYPANKNSDISEYLAHEGYSVFMEQMENAMARPRVVNWIKINDDYIGTALDSILVGGEDPESTLKQAQDDANAIFGERVE